MRVYTDHSANHGYFQEKYRILVALPIGEAGLCLTALHLKAYFYSMSPRQIMCDDEKVLDAVRQADDLADSI